MTRRRQAHSERRRRRARRSAGGPGTEVDIEIAVLHVDGELLEPGAVCRERGAVAGVDEPVGVPFERATAVLYPGSSGQKGAPSLLRVVLQVLDEDVERTAPRGIGEQDGAAR